MSFKRENWPYRLGLIIFICLLWIIPITMYIKSRPKKDDGFVKYELKKEAVYRMFYNYGSDETKRAIKNWGER